MPSFAEIVDRDITLEKMRCKRGRSKWNRYDPDVIPLMVSDPDYPVPSEIREAALQAIEDDCWNYSWFPEAREAMAETTRTKYGIKETTVDDLIVTPGVSPCIKLSAMYACKPGDEVMVQSTMYAPFLSNINYVNAKPVYLPITQEEKWKFDIDKISKTFGLAGLEIGWLVATNKEIMEEISKIAYGLIRGTTSISYAVTHAVLTKCEKYLPALVEYLQDLRDYGAKRLSDMDNVTVVPPEGTYVLWPNFTAYGLSSTEMYEYLLEKGRVAVANGSRYGPGGEGYQRVVFPTSKAILAEGLDRIETALSKI